MSTVAAAAGNMLTIIKGGLYGQPRDAKPQRKCLWDYLDAPPEPRRDFAVIVKGERVPTTPKSRRAS